MVQYRDPGPVFFGAAPYRGQHRLGVRKDVQKSLGKTQGDKVSVELVLDTDRADLAGD
jgi:hypothetical protein